MASTASTMARAASRLTGRRPIDRATPIRVGVDLGTAYTVVMVTDAAGSPLAGASVFADVVRDGIVWDFAGATDVVRGLKADVERRTGRTLTSGAVTIPPGVSASDHRAHGYVLQGAGIECTAVIDEPTAANAVLGVRDGAVVDIGGGTTGVAILRGGEVVKTLDEPSGGTHLSLVIAGALGISVEAAEKLKCDPAEHQRLLPIVSPVLEKLATIVRDGIAGESVEYLYLVGGTSAFAGLEPIMTRITGVGCEVAPVPILITPLGVAHFADSLTETGPR